MTCGLLLALAATTSTASTTPAKLELVVLKSSWSALGWRYTEPQQPDLGGERLFTAFNADIETYAWSSQAITLTLAASESLERALTGAVPAVPRLSALKERLGHGNALERALSLHGFFVALNGTPLYWGIVLDPPSQMAIEFPVLRVGRHAGKVVFHVLPVHLPFFESDPVSSDGAGAASVEASEVPGGMLDHFRERARNPVAVALRARIRDERVRQVLEDRGALRP